MQANVNNCKQIQRIQQIQSNISKCTQIQTNQTTPKQMQAVTSKCKQVQENSKKMEVLPGINKPAIWRFINAGRLFEDNVDNNVRKQFVKHIQENPSEYKQI